MAIPSSTVSTTNLASNGSNAKQSKDTFFDAINKLNGTLSGINTANNLCPLNSQGKITTDKIIGRLDNTSMANRCVTSAKINAGQTSGTGIENVKFRDNQITTAKLSELSTDVTLGGNNPSTSNLPTQNACKQFVDNSGSGTQLMHIKWEFGDIKKSNRSAQRYGSPNYYYNLHYVPTPTIATPTPFNFISSTISSWNSFQYHALDPHPYLVKISFSGTTHTTTQPYLSFRYTRQANSRPYSLDQRMSHGSYINASTTTTTPREHFFIENFDNINFYVITDSVNRDYGFKDFTLEIMRVF